MLVFLCILVCLMSTSVHNEERFDNLIGVSEEYLYQDFGTYQTAYMQDTQTKIVSYFFSDLQEHKTFQNNIIPKECEVLFTIKKHKVVAYRYNAECDNINQIKTQA